MADTGRRLVAVGLAMALATACSATQTGAPRVASSPTTSAVPAAPVASVAAPGPTGTSQGFAAPAPLPPGATWTAVRWVPLDPASPLALLRAVVPWSGGYLGLGSAPGAPYFTSTWTSPDGVRWTAAERFASATILGAAVVPAGLVVLAWGPDGSSVPLRTWTSRDGAAWVSHAGPDIGMPFDARNVDGTRVLLAAGSAGLLVVTSPAAAGTSDAFLSGDGTSWTPLPAGSLPAGFVGVAASGSARGYTLVGNRGSPLTSERAVVVTSGDGRHWTAQSLPAPEFAPTLYRAATLLVGSSGMLVVGASVTLPSSETWWRASDGRPWQLISGFDPLPVASGGAGYGPLGAVAGDGTRLVAISTPARAWVSFDAQVWTPLAFGRDGPRLPDQPAVVVLPFGIRVLARDGTPWLGEASAR